LVRAALALAVAACGGDGVTVRPVYQQPVDDPDALATGLDTVELSVARAGDERALLSVSFAPGAEANLDDVPFADDLVIHLTGRIGATDVAYGRTCAFALAPDAPPPDAAPVVRPQRQVRHHAASDRGPAPAVRPSPPPMAAST
jgi:hypothetical protein